MKSKAHINGHPLHPILIAFPIAFFTGAFFMDAAGYLSMRPWWIEIGKYLAAGGVITALVAALPGLVDYFGIIPPESSAKKRATSHMLINILNVVIFAVAVYLRQYTTTPFSAILVMELLGIILLTIAGWKGGTLVYRNQIAVYNRYANAGLWNEKHLGKKSGVIPVAEIDELKAGQMKLIHMNGKRIVIGRTESGFVAFDDHCTHRGGSLADGVLICGVVQCPWHGSQFDCTTGEVKAGPAKEKIGTYLVKAEGDHVYLTV